MCQANFFAGHIKNSECIVSATSQVAVSSFNRRPSHEPWLATPAAGLGDLGDDHQGKVVARRLCGELCGLDVRLKEDRPSASSDVVQSWVPALHDLLQLLCPVLWIMHLVHLLERVALGMNHEIARYGTWWASKGDWSYIDLLHRMM